MALGAIFANQPKTPLITLDSPLAISEIISMFWILQQDRSLGNARWYYFDFGNVIVKMLP
jgi:hypothetical protein